MKNTTKYLLAGALALAGSASPALAQTEITITGATAFRQATLKAIYNAYDSIGDLGVNFNVAHGAAGNATNQLSQLIASDRAIFRGTFPGITGETIIRTSFNGSTEGLNAIAGNSDPSFYEVAGIPSGITPLYTGNLENLRPKFSFSDVYQSTSPVDNIQLNPVGASEVGVVTFAMIANTGAPANWNNMTVQQCVALWTSGIQKLSLFTGDPADDGVFVLATGRNDGSGTRSAYLTEWQYGVANTVNQYVATTAGITTSGVITAISLVPQGGNGTGNLLLPDGTGNRSTLWGNDVLGNGGYRSSSALRGIMQRTSASVDVYNGVDQAADLEDQAIHLVTWLSTSDSRNAATGGAKILAFNGVQVTPLASNDANNFNGTGFNETDFNKIVKGAYSAWSYQHLYHHGSLNANEQIWRDGMTEVGGFLEVGLAETANGVTLGNMQSSRPGDGDPISAPLF